MTFCKCAAMLLQEQQNQNDMVLNDIAYLTLQQATDQMGAAKFIQSSSLRDFYRPLGNK
jgi:hypothetical protein